MYNGSHFIIITISLNDESTQRPRVQSLFLFCRCKNSRLIHLMLCGMYKIFVLYQELVRHIYWTDSLNFELRPSANLAVGSIIERGDGLDFIPILRRSRNARCTLRAFPYRNMLSSAVFNCKGLGLRVLVDMWLNVCRGVVSVNEQLGLSTLKRNSSISGG